MNAQTINTVIFVLGTFVSVLSAIYVSRMWIQRLPEHTRKALDQFTRMAVQQVEQQNASLSNTAKKQLAIAIVTKFFQAYRLPLPPPHTVDSAIEATVFLLPKSGKTHERDNSGA